MRIFGGAVDSSEHGEEATRHVVGVGALNPDDQGTFTLAIEVFERIGTKLSESGKGPR